MRLVALALTLSMGVSGAASAAQRTFEGSEAAALRCANTLAHTAMTLWRAEKLSANEKDVMLGVTVLILERHVSGSWHQKKRAMVVMRDRRDTTETLNDYRKNAAKCLAQFPIN